MSRQAGLSLVVASFLFGSSPSFAGGTSPAWAAHTTAAITPVNVPISTGLPRQAPVGHRQPRPRDVPEITQLSPIDSELRRLDEEVDRKLTICRGC